MSIEEVREEVDGWISDLGSTAGRASVHDRLVMIYWVLMNLVTYSNLSAAAKVEEKLAEMMAKKEGDEDPIKAWKNFRIFTGRLKLSVWTTVSCTERWTR